MKGSKHNFFLPHEDDEQKFIAYNAFRNSLALIMILLMLIFITSCSYSPSKKVENNTDASNEDVSQSNSQYIAWDEYESVNTEITNLPIELYVETPQHTGNTGMYMNSQMYAFTVDAETEFALEINKQKGELTFSIRYDSPKEYIYQSGDIEDGIYSDVITLEPGDYYIVMTGNKFSGSYHFYDPSKVELDE